MKESKIKKNTFVKGAFITSLGIILTKILGVIYVVPFHAIVGDKGGALYSYAYTIYLLFVSLSTAGIPLAISKLVSEYQSLGYYKIKDRVFIIGKRLALLVGFISCFLIFMLAPFFAKFIFGDVVGSNSLEDTIFVIRVISFAMLFSPLISIYRGYFEGHRFMSIPSISQIIEQLARIIFIILGCLIALKIINLSISGVVGVALFGATFGIVVCYLYLLFVYKKNKKSFAKKLVIKEPIISSKSIAKKIIYYAIPFIMVDLFKSFYNYVDMFSVVKVLVKYASFDAYQAEIVYSMMSTWAQKFNLIIYAISSGIIVSLIPNITEKFIQKEYSEVNNIIIRAISILLFIITPMTLGICFLAKPIWLLFYGNSAYGPSVLGLYIFVGFSGAIFSLLVNILLSLKDYRNMVISLIVGFIFKIIFNISIVKAFIYFGLPAYYGFICATILGFVITIIMCLVIFNIKYNIDFEKIVNVFVDVISGSLIMVFVLLIFKLFIPIYSDTRIINLFNILIYALIGVVIYFYYSYVSGLFKNVFGNFRSKLFK